jgi:hypothetical protein
MRKYLLLITLLLSERLANASSLFPNLDTVDAQFFEQVVTTDFPPNEPKLETPSLENVDEEEVYTLPLPAEGYAYLMKHIQSLNPLTYENLKACEEKMGVPCLRKNGKPNGKDYLLPPTDESQGYPIIVLPSNFAPWERTYDQAEEINYLNTVIQNYNPIPPTTLQEQLHFLTIVEQLAPELYIKIITVDPTGENHIKRFWSKSSRGAQLQISEKDGLPIIRVGTTLIDESPAIQQYVVGHELGHYALDHDGEYDDYTAYDKKMNPKNATEDYSEKYSPFVEILEHAYNRSQEEEADRFSIMNLGAPLEGGIAYFKKKTHKSRRKTFNQDHPLHNARIAHLESLRREVELQKAHGTILPPIDWDTLIQRYTKRYTKESEKELQEAL